MNEPIVDKYTYYVVVEGVPTGESVTATSHKWDSGIGHLDLFDDKTEVVASFRKVLSWSRAEIGG